MADNEQNTSSGQVRSFDKSLNEDANDFHLPSNEWTQARNVINNSVTGDLGKLGNEPANKECIRLNYAFATIIGFIHIIEDKWLIFSTDGAGTSQIGLFKESLCRYDVLVDDPCLGFTLENLIIGESRSTSSCTFKAYWDDGNNPSRNIEFNVSYMDESVLYDPLLDANIYSNPHTTVPYIQTCVINNGCNYCTNTPALDCDKLRLAQFIKPICIRVEKGVSGGNILNGSFMVVMAYAVKGQKISDWYISNVQGLFDHNNSASSLDVYIDDIDLEFDEVIVGIISTINQQTVVRQAGIYSTRQTNFSFDTIFDTWPAIPVEQIPIMTPIVNKSDAMYNVGDYLLRVGPTSKFDFNYQPLANQIRVKWQSVEYPADYYHKGGNKTGYMRDEVYPFFIVYEYDTGDESASYHIPGRPPFASDLVAIAPGTPNAILGDNVTWQVFNTATTTTIFPLPPALGANVLPDGGVVRSEGYMGYWESSEIYPDDKPQIWNANIAVPVYSGTQASHYDLCGKPIRHHKFPEDGLSNETTLFNTTVGDKIRIMGVTFDNIKPPVDEFGNTIPGIIGYKILRGSRNGNKTVIAKGMINNMGEYTIPGSGKKGLYPNFPYNDLRSNPFLSSTPTKTLFSTNALNPGTSTELNIFRDTNFTFHSPDTNFNNPFLSTKELRVYGQISGAVEGNYSVSEKHPKEKLVSDIAFLFAALAGIGIAVLAANGKKQVTYQDPYIPGYSQDGLQTLQNSVAVPYSGASIISLSVPGSNGAQPSFSDTGQIPANATLIATAEAPYNVASNTGIFIGGVLTGFDRQNFPVLGLKTTYDNKYSAATSNAFAKPGAPINQEGGYIENMGILAVASAMPMFFNYFQDGADSFIRLIRSMLKYRDFAVRYHSHCFYDSFGAKPSTFRFELDKQIYTNPEILNFDANTSINNLYRSRTVSLQTKTSVPNAVGDNSRFLPSATDIEDLTNKSYGSQAASQYVGLKVRIRNQYGQLNNIIQLPTDSCYSKMIFNSAGQLLDPNDPSGLTVITSTNTGTIFGGDVYINRYTEKNTFFFFYDWLEGQPDGAQFDYTKHKMVPHPIYWANFEQFQTSDFVSDFFSTAATFSSPTLNTAQLPHSYYVLQGTVAPPNLIAPFSSGVPSAFDLGVKGWFHLFQSGVRDFFVESEINVAYRDYGELPEQKFYDPYSGGSTKSLFETSIIKSGNFYKYDISLSVTKQFRSYVSWAAMQSPQYDPYISATCFVYQDSRIIYSLPAQYEGLKDGWKVFLTNNYYDFDNIPTCIKPINKNGAIIFFDAASPVQFQGTDQLQTSLGTKLTIGDGGLFSQPLQALVNVESSHEYGSCQNRLSVINTPAGVFWMSQNQGKIFTIVGGGIKEVSGKNLKWWFASYLPYQIIEDFPDFELLDNPVIGVACQSVYDNENGLLYFCKKDYSLKKDVDETIVYVTGNKFNIVDSEGNIIGDIELGNPNSQWNLYFDDASWTASYDPKKDDWLGWHDWHPNFCLPGKNTFMTVNPLDRNSLWIHNERCDLYCNYYGIDYPFEVEFTVNTGQDVNSLRSIQYILECYKYAPNCYDRFHVLDFNFDEATVYNTEQTSGLLKLILNPKNDPTAILQYPIINPTNINVLFSKEENKYRFNQFWDITEDRGEFFNSLIPGFAQRAIWDTQPNGYIRLLNANNLNYNKADFQKKKFRHYTVSVLLRKLVSGDRKMLVMLSDVKNLLSPR